MSKLMQHVVTGVAIAVTALGFGIDVMAADATQATASRTVSCPTGFDKVGTATNVYCRWPNYTLFKTPHCGPKNLRDDWHWFSDRKQCCRDSGSQQVCSTENILCGDVGGQKGKYDAASNRCELYHGSGAFATPVLTGGGTVSGNYVKCSTSAACDRSLKCLTAGFTVTQSGTPTQPGTDYFCQKSVAGTGSVPTCGPVGLTSDYQFDSDSKQCCRGTAKTRICSTANIKCPTGATYMSFKGMCVTPAVTTYEAPILSVP